MAATIDLHARAGRSRPARFEFQMLYGLRPRRWEELVAAGFNMRVYVPFGTHWIPYFYRRLRERRENVLSFVAPTQSLVLARERGCSEGRRLSRQGRPARRGRARARARAGRDAGAGGRVRDLPDRPQEDREAACCRGRASSGTRSRAPSRRSGRARARSARGSAWWCTTTCRAAPASTASAGSTRSVPSTRRTAPRPASSRRAAATPSTCSRATGSSRAA